MTPQKTTGQNGILSIYLGNLNSFQSCGAKIEENAKFLKAESFRKKISSQADNTFFRFPNFAYKNLIHPIAFIYFSKIQNYEYNINTELC